MSDEEIFGFLERQREHAATLEYILDKGLISSTAAAEWLGIGDSHRLKYYAEILNIQPTIANRKNGKIKLYSLDDILAIRNYLKSKDETGIQNLTAWRSGLAKILADKGRIVSSHSKMLELIYGLINFYETLDVHRTVKDTINGKH